MFSELRPEGVLRSSWPVARRGEEGPKLLRKARRLVEARVPLGAQGERVQPVHEGFAAIARRYAARPDAERTAGNLARALWDFARIGLTPAVRLDRFVREQRQPVPPEPELSARSGVWAREHRVATMRTASNA